MNLLLFPYFGTRLLHCSGRVNVILPNPLNNKWRGYAFPIVFAGLLTPCYSEAMVGPMVQPRSASASSLTGRRGCRGQAMIEYIIVFIALFATIVSVAAFLYVIRQQSNRTLDLVASDYP